MPEAEAGKHHKEQHAAAQSPSGNPLNNLDPGATPAPTAARPAAPKKIDLSAAKADLKQANAAEEAVSNDGQKLVKDVKNIEDAMWAQMKGQNEASPLRASGHALMEDAKNFDMLGLEKKAQKLAKKAVADAESKLKQLGDSMGDSNGPSIRQAAKRDIHAQDKAMKLTIDMASVYNKIKSEAGDLSTIDLSDVDADVNALPKDIKTAVAAMNHVASDAKQIAMLESKVEADDKKAEREVVELDH